MSVSLASAVEVRGCGFEVTHVVGALVAVTAVAAVEPCGELLSPETEDDDTVRSRGRLDRKNGRVVFAGECFPYGWNVESVGHCVSRSLVVDGSLPADSFAYIEGGCHNISGRRRR